VSASAAPAIRQLLIGGYTAESGGTATGVRALLNTAGGDGRLSLVEQMTLSLPSPTYLIGHPEGPWVFAVSEDSPSTLSSLEVDWEGNVRLLSTVPSGGDGACHVALSRDSRFLFVSHYGSGSIASFAIKEDGTLSERIDLLEFSGSGPDERQESAHAHQVVLDGDDLLVCDLGSDKIHRVAFDPTEGTFGTAADPISLPAGSGPRHLVLVGDFVTVACELSGQLWFARRNDDDWEHIRTVASSATDADIIQPSGVIAVDNRVFVANRGADTIAVFDVEQATGWLTRVTEFGSGGHWPRDLVVRDGWLWVSNERGHTISVFGISPLPPEEPATEIPSPSPTCLLLLPVASEA
jgi:6-phosphogluconolactonase